MTLRQLEAGLSRQGSLLYFELLVDILVSDEGVSLLA